MSVSMPNLVTIIFFSFLYNSGYAGYMFFSHWTEMKGNDIIWTMKCEFKQFPWEHPDDVVPANHIIILNPKKQAIAMVTETQNYAKLNIDDESWDVEGFADGNEKRPYLMAFKVNPTSADNGMYLCQAASKNMYGRKTDFNNTYITFHLTDADNAQESSFQY